jgi:hypothetical protein
VVTDKATRVFNFHSNTLHNLAELMGAAGLRKTSEITADLIMVRQKGGPATPLSTELTRIATGCLLNGDTSTLPEPYRSLWGRSSADRFGGSALN